MSKPGQPNGKEKYLEFTVQFRKWLESLEEVEHDEVFSFMKAMAREKIRSHAYLDRVSSEGNFEIWTAKFTVVDIDFIIYFAKPHACDSKIHVLLGAQLTGNFRDLKADARKLVRTLPES